MTEYPVQCYNNNGEPYGRYKNPNPRPLDDKKYLEWMKFESFAEANTFPMLGAEIGKSYDSVEVEISWQTEFGIDNWVSSDTIPDSVKNLGWYTERQIFRLAQPVKKEPETVEQASTYWEHRLLNLQQELRDTLFIRPYALEEIEKCGVRLCDAIVEFVEKQEASYDQ